MQTKLFVSKYVHTYVVKTREVHVCIEIFEVPYFLSKKKGNGVRMVVKSILSLHQRKKTKNAEHREFSLKIKCTAKVTSQIRKHFNLVRKLQQKLNNVQT